MTDPAGYWRETLIREVPYVLRTELSPHIAERITLDPSIAEREARRVALKITAGLLTETLPPERISHRIAREHPEAIGHRGTAADARFATWRDHFIATYRGRWWARLLRLHKREIRWQFVAVPYLVSRPVRCEHEVTVDVRAAWTYPRARPALDGERGGHPVLRADSFTVASAPVLRAIPYEDAELWR